jgi:FkbM family methyltransferase
MSGSSTASPTANWRQSRLFIPIRLFVARIKSHLHDRKMRRFYAQFVRRGGLCFDIGANVGNRTGIFVKLGARVIAIEPQTACIEILRRRFGRHPLVTIVPLGVSSAPGQASLSLSDDSSTIASLSPEFRENWRWSHRVKWTKQETIQLTTLDLLIAKFGVPDFCKIDVEGFELQVLSGLTRPIPALSFEFNIELVDKTRECITKLQSLDYHRFNYSVGESMSLHLNDWIEGEALVNMLRSERDPLFWGDVYAKE